MEIPIPSDYTAALVLHNKCVELLAKNPTLESTDDWFLRASVPCGIYRHFKSTDANPKHYAVTGVDRHVNRNEANVSYRALYPPHTMKGAALELTGPDSFLMPVDRALDSGRKYRGPRFVLIEKCMLETLYIRAKDYIVE